MHPLAPILALIGATAVIALAAGELDRADEPTPAASEAADLTIGIDGHYAGWPREEVEDRAALGAPVTRHEWDLYNPVESEEQQVIAGATEIGTRLHALLGGNDIGEGDDDYRDYVVEFVRYWGPGGSFWEEHPELDESRYAITSIELGNEPYFGEMSAEEYADAVRPALEAVAELDVPIKVILPGYAKGDDPYWIDTLYERIPDLNDLFYAFASHPYWYGHDPAEPGEEGSFEQIEALREQMANHGAGEKPLYITEYGESTAGCDDECVDEETQAEHLAAMLDAVASFPEWKVELLAIYQLRDHGTENGDREEQFGLLREDGSPKPAYSVVRDAIQRYDG
jgi:hypothetical protein